jgi:cytochrome c556
MRLMLLSAAAGLLLAACGGPQSSQANNVQANISNDARPQETAAASAVTGTGSGASVPMSPVAGDQAKALMHERHEGMESIGKASKAIHDQLQSGSPDLGLVRSSASKITDLSQKASGWFHAGTGPDVGKTGARPEIWQNPQDFSAKLANFQVAAKAFQEAANGNDIAAIKAKLGPLGQACKACHDKYRSKMEH